MAEPITISSDPPEDIGLDYQALLAEGVAIVQSLSGTIWTDYNEHDPGVTTLEQVCYALTELSYRAGLPVADMLTDEDSGEIDAQRQALYLPQVILPCNPVTVNDYRKLIVDAVPEIANVYLRGCPSETYPGTGGLYQIYLYGPDVDECACDGERSAPEIVQTVRDLYCGHRDLCEDLDDIQFLTPCLSRVSAVIQVAQCQAPARLMAEILFTIDLILAPRIQRSTLKQWLDKGATSEAIFNGPLLQNGLIEPQQLDEKTRCLPVSDILQGLLDLSFIKTVANLKVTTLENGKVYSGGDTVPVAFSQFLKLDLSESKSGQAFSVSLYYQGNLLTVNRTLVMIELQKLFRDCQQTYDMAIQYEQYFPMPKGERRDFSAYYSIQNQYPDLYGINEYGVATSEPTIRHAQAKQLKGYLLVYDQLMANFFAQISHVKNLFSTQPVLEHSYFYQYINEDVPNVAPILKTSLERPNYFDGLPDLVHSQDPVNQRRARFLGFMLAMYGQTMQVESGNQDSDACSTEKYSEEEVQAKLDWLTHLVTGTVNRGQAMNYLGPLASTHNFAPMQIKVRLELGMSPLGSEPLAQMTAKLAVKLVADDVDASYGCLDNSLNGELDHVFCQLSPVQLPKDKLEANVNHIGLLKGHKIGCEFIQSGAKVNNYWIGVDENRSGVTLLCRSDKGGWHFVDQFPDHTSACRAVWQLSRLLKRLLAGCRQLYVVENILLRYAQGIEQSSTVDGSAFDYSFTLSAVICLEGELYKDADYINSVRQVLRRNTPAHIVLDIHFLSPWRMLGFEVLYWHWRKALKVGTLRDKQIRSAALRDYLMAGCVRRPR